MSLKDPEARRAYHKAWRLKNKERYDAITAAWRAKNKERISSGMRRNAYRRRYGITIEEYDALLARQGGKCAICRAEKSTGRGRFHVDHDHATGLVRGILCHVCNTKLGWVDRYMNEWTTYLATHYMRIAKSA